MNSNDCITAKTLPFTMSLSKFHEIVSETLSYLQICEFLNNSTNNYGSNVKHFIIFELCFGNLFELRHFFQHVVIPFSGHKEGAPIGRITGAGGVWVYNRRRSGQANHQNVAAGLFEEDKSGKDDNVCLGIISREQQSCHFCRNSRIVSLLGFALRITCWRCPRITSKKKARK